MDFVLDNVAKGVIMLGDLYYNARDPMNCKPRHAVVLKRNLLFIKVNSKNRRTYKWMFDSSEEAHDWYDAILSHLF